jgi:hypothetical protein
MPEEVHFKNDLYSEAIFFRCTPTEKETIKEEAAARHITASSVIREKLFSTFNK